MKNEPSFIEIYLTKTAFFLYGKSVYKSFADRLPIHGNESVLDFGCGMGTVAYYTAERLMKGHLTCLDISERWIKACKRTLRKYWNVSYIKSDYKALPKEDFDIVYCHFVLHDISDEELKNVIPALVKSLKQNGVLFIREPLVESNKLNLIKFLLLQNKMTHKSSLVTNIPLMGNALESLYIKFGG